MKRFLPILPIFVFAVLVAIFFKGLSGDPQRLASTLIDKPVPAFQLPAVEGLTIPGLTSTDLTGRGVTIVNIWASWCGPCRDEHPILMKLSEDADLRIVGINNKDNPQNATRFLSSMGNPYDAVGGDINGRVTIDWGGYGVPETFIVDSKGIIRHKHVGPLQEQDLTGKFGAALKAAQP